MQAAEKFPHLTGAIDFIAIKLIALRKPLCLLFLALTVWLGVSAEKLRLDPGFNKLIPQAHEYMNAFMQYTKIFSGANRVMVSVHWKGEGDIYNARFLEVLRQVNDAVFFVPGVNRGGVRSLFTPSVRYVEVTENGFNGDVVIPSRFEPNAQGLAQVRANVARSGEIGRLVPNDVNWAMVQADLLEIQPDTGEKLDYGEVANRLEEIRRTFGGPDIEVQIIGFVKVMGEVMNGLFSVFLFFAVAFVITAILLWLYTRSLKLTLIVLTVAVLPVVWLLGLLPMLGYGVDPMSVLVPFLIFSIGVSHAVQMTNGWRQEVLSGHSSVEAAERAFRALAVPCSMAIVTAALGFLVIMIIAIPILHELGVSACVGVTLMLVTNMILLPAVLSHVRMERPALKAPIEERGARRGVWGLLSVCARPGPSLVIFAGMLVLLVAGTYHSRNLSTGDVASGVPELREDSRYNRDNDFIVRNYSIGMDILSVYVETANLEEACLDWRVMNAVERFDLHMRGVAGVQSVSTVAGRAKLFAAGSNEANPRWAGLQRSEEALRTGVRAANPEQGLNTAGCRAINLLVYLTDHKAPTLHHVVGEARRFIEQDQTPNVRFRLAGGNAGVAVATNEAVERAEVQMLASIYGAIVLICWLMFRSWRAVLCIIVPLLLVSILCNALMALFGIGLKVATLPVIALGVGVGVDYGIYIYERLQHELRAGAATLQDAFYEAMYHRGTPAIFTALTMSVGVGTWMASTLKFQADMGLLLAFMFLVNALGAIFVLPALACWLGVGRGSGAGRAE